MIVSISQPAYLPWLGYFNRIARSDIAIVLDSVMLERSSVTRFTNRNKIKTSQGWSWLTVPVKTAGIDQPLICEVELDIHQNWAEKHLRSTLQSYSRGNHISSHIDWLKDFYSRPWTHLSPMLDESTSYLLGALNINTPLLYSSKMRVDGSKSMLILNLCKSVGATTYLSGPFGRNYLDHKIFDEAGIKLDFDDYIHPVYPQLHSGFQPFMSVIDLLFNCGGASIDILRSHLEFNGIS